VGKTKIMGTWPQGTKWSISFHTTDLSQIYKEELMPRKLVNIPLSFKKNSWNENIKHEGIQSSDFCPSVEDVTLFIIFALLQLFRLFLCIKLA
jgi:hypothetical protein